jgi:polysaccharide biosynthesis/export protein
MGPFVEAGSAHGGGHMKTLASFCRLAFLTLAMSQLLSNCMTNDAQTNQPMATAPPATNSALGSTGPVGSTGPTEGTGGSAGAGVASGHLANPDYRIVPRDILQITVFQIQDLNTAAQVNEDGSVNLPLVGKIPLSGLTVYEAEQTIGSRLRKFVQSPQVTVAVKQYGKRITISGEVRSPKVLADDGNSTLSQAIAESGGVGDLADSTRVHLARSRNQHVQDMIFNLDDIQAGRAQDPLLMGGDIVVVETAGHKVALKTVTSLLPLAVLAALI